ncbi:ComEA family DNA-binding protein [Leucobacter chinensis]|uniref:ComEA family DNA-binding protein n=1 Tax=Leucobacter chinensis TaxID=2851010 RepID=UPI001C23BF2B|nr:ComEA family DNA-binding protein [Leucobacter chinensis]
MNLDENTVPKPGRVAAKPRSPAARSDGEAASWKVPESLPRRLFRAIATPPAAGVIIFILVVLVAVILALVRSNHAFSLEGSETSANDEANASEILGGEASRGEAGSNDSRSEGDRGADPGDRSSKGAESASVFVHVLGEVKKPGVIELTSGERVQQAIQAAGGVTDKASLVGVNLAREVIDGEQILVPAEGEQSEQPGSSGAAAPEAGGPVNLNSADAAALETLPRIGPALAARIIEWRDANGGFRSVDDLMNVSGIGPKVFAELRDLVTAP